MKTISDNFPFFLAIFLLYMGSIGILPFLVPFSISDLYGYQPLWVPSVALFVGFVAFGLCFSFVDRLVTDVGKGLFIAALGIPVSIGMITFICRTQSTTLLFVGVALMGWFASMLWVFAQGYLPTICKDQPTKGVGRSMLWFFALPGAVLGPFCLDYFLTATSIPQLSNNGFEAAYSFAFLVALSGFAAIWIFVTVPKKTKLKNYSRKGWFLRAMIGAVVVSIAAHFQSGFASYLKGSLFLSGSLCFALLTSLLVKRG